MFPQNNFFALLRGWLALASYSKFVLRLKIWENGFTFPRSNLSQWPTQGLFLGLSCISSCMPGLRPPWGWALLSDTHSRSSWHAGVSVYICAAPMGHVNKCLPSRINVIITGEYCRKSHTCPLPRLWEREGKHKPAATGNHERFESEFTSEEGYQPCYYNQHLNLQW